MKRYLPYALLVAPFAAQASAQNYFEARNSAMGGVGVASSKYKAAAFANPALLTRFGEDDDFGVLLPVVGAFANDPTNFVDDVDVFVDEFDRIQQQFDAAAVPTQGELDALANQLRGLDGRELTADVGFGFAVAMPSDKLAWALHIKSYGDVTTFAEVDPTDAQAIEDAATTGVFNDTLRSKGRALGVVKTEAGISLATQYEVGGMPLSVGITPKYQRIDTINYGVTLESYDNDNFDADEYLNDSGGFNLDAGATLETSNGFIFGLMARDLISSDYESKTILKQDFLYEVGPSLTAGASWTYGWLTLASDLDLLAQERIKEPAGGIGSVGLEDDVQMWGIGAEFDLAKWVQLRAGYQTDLKNYLDDAITAGAGFAIFDTFHIEVAGMYIDDNSLGAVAQLSFTF
jgi:hypothetical protein